MSLLRDNFTDLVEGCAWFHNANCFHQGVICIPYQPLAVFSSFTNYVRLITIPVVSIQDHLRSNDHVPFSKYVSVIRSIHFLYVLLIGAYCHIYVDNISIFQRSSIWNTMANNFVDGCAD